MFACPETDTWCCNKGDPVPAKQRVNRTNTACCSINEQVFKAPWPTILAPAAYSQTGTPVPIVFLTDTTTSQSPSSTATNSPAAYDASGASSASATPQHAAHSSSLAIGLGTGFGVAAVIALALGWMFLRRRNKRATEATSADFTKENGPSENGRVMMAGSEVAEKDGTDHFNGRDVKPTWEMCAAESLSKPKGDVYRAELPAESAAELPASFKETDRINKHDFDKYT
jgi:hypothetical protein